MGEVVELLKWRSLEREAITIWQWLQEHGLTLAFLDGELEWFSYVGLHWNQILHRQPEAAASLQRIYELPRGLVKRALEREWQRVDDINAVAEQVELQRQRGRNVRQGIGVTVPALPTD